MKTIRNLLLGLTVLILATSLNASNAAVPVTTKPVAKAKKMRTDSYELFFGFTATPVSGSAGYYDIVVTYNQYDINSRTIYPINNNPSYVSITITSGPYAGLSFPYSAGISHQDLGSLYFGANPTGTNYSITTSPTSENGLPIVQSLISHLP